MARPFTRAFLLTVAVQLILVLNQNLALASEGDTHPQFIQCNVRCQSDCALEESTGAEPQWRTWDLWLTGWTCRENCRYKCMQEDVALRELEKRPTVKYYGKWPFRRVLGLQELFSSLFSVANFVPHFQYFFIWRKVAPATYFMKPLWTAYACSAMWTWFWSAAFHARDTVLTERMDYFGATMSLMFMLFLSIVRVARITDRRRWVMLGIPFVLYFIGHCLYLHFIHFHYGYNMTFSIIIAVAYLASFTAWAFVNRKRPYMWKLIIANTIILIFAFFEVFDFPPVWSLIDAHAVWHAATPIAAYLTWSFLLDDATYSSYDLSSTIRRGNKYYDQE